MRTVIFKDWLNIRRARPDITDYLIHWTAGHVTDGKYHEPFEVLKEIIACGYLKPSFALKQSKTVGGTQNTIKGPYPAVCFTDQPLDAFLKSCGKLPSRYSPYGIAVHKWHLYTYGGRPVIYADESLLNLLPDEYKYLWVRYDPVPEPTLGGYPVDWTHEREWRVRQRSYSYGDLGVSPQEGVPLLLPPVSFPNSEKPVVSLPRFLVKTEAESHELKEWINHLPPCEGTNGVLRYYFEALPKALVIPLEIVKIRLSEGDLRYARLETLPYKELDPSFDLPTPESYL